MSLPANRICEQQMGDADAPVGVRNGELERMNHRFQRMHPRLRNHTGSSCSIGSQMQFDLVRSESGKPSSMSASWGKVMTPGGVSAGVPPGSRPFSLLDMRIGGNIARVRP
jgi:hypothetical protein